jgi:glycosyltransferase involved in cell wall biosynthesis
MRVAVASWTSRYAGGIESYLGAVMPAMRRAGLEVAFFYEADEPSSRERIDLADAVPVFSVPSTGVGAAVRQLSQWKPDVLYIHGLHDVDTADRLLDLAPSVTFVHTYVGTCISGTKTHRNPRAMACSRQFGRACLALYLPRGCGGRNPVTMMHLYRTQWRRQENLARQAAVITHSEHMKDELVRHGIAASVVSYPVSVPDVDDNHTHESIDILFAGRMENVKGGALLLNALPLIRRAIDTPLRVEFAGDGPERQQWDEISKAIQANDPEIAVRFSGWADEKQLSAKMRASRLLVVPSVWPEPFGSVGMAAGQHGVPAAAFAVGGIPQWLRDGVNGHLAPTPPAADGLAEAIVKCLRDPSHYQDLSRGAAEMAARFTMERHIPEVISVFERVVHA